jgi:pantoate--beta-alanine ligase
VAPLLWQTLQSCGAALAATPVGPPASIIDPAREALEQAGFTVDYLELRELSTLQLVENVDQDCALFVAARLGDTRLIDNIKLAASS